MFRRLCCESTNSAAQFDACYVWTSMHETLKTNLLSVPLYSALEIRCKCLRACSTRIASVHTVDAASPSRTDPCRSCRFDNARFEPAVRQLADSRSGRPDRYRGHSFHHSTHCSARDRSDHCGGTGRRCPQWQTLEEGATGAATCDQHTSELATASRRIARQGVPTYIYSNNNSTVSQAEADEHGEKWLSYPDNDLKFTWKAGDFRAAVAPFLTYDLIGSTFDWLLYGDDDTIFFAHGTARLLADFDAGMPYIITGAAVPTQCFG